MIAASARLIRRHFFDFEIFVMGSNSSADARQVGG